MPGRPPKPTALKLATGNPGKRPLNLQEPKPTVGLPDPPAWLPDSAKPHYLRLGAQLVATKVMTMSDGDALAWLAYLTAAAVEKIGEGKQPVMLIKELRSHRAEFGMSPSGRVRIRVAEPEKKESNVSRFLRAV